MTRSVFPKPIYIGASVRTPIGKFGGSLKRFTAPELATIALKASVQKSGLNTADFVFLGHARQAGAGPNPARQATVNSGLGEKIPAITVNQACASGLAAIINAAEKISLGKAQNIFAGGTESMSNTPYFLMNGRWGTKMGNMEITDGMRKDGFFCPMSQLLMGETVEKILVPEFQISRKEQDALALLSQKNADAAWKRGDYLRELCEMPGDAKSPALKEDEHRRGDSTEADLAKLSPTFDKAGTITAGNSSGITDGAAFTLVSSLKNSASQAEILDYEVISLDPKRMGLGPVEATQNLLKRQALQTDDIEAYELNEAFAAQVIACQRTLNIPEQKVNAWGGAIALGHPIGCTGTRITVTLLNRLSGKNGALGLTTLCVSGGQGVSLLLRML